MNYIYYKASQLFHECIYLLNYILVKSQISWMKTRSLKFGSCSLEWGENWEWVALDNNHIKISVCVDLHKILTVTLGETPWSHSFSTAQ